MSEDPRPGTTAAIDRRVEGLATQIDDLSLRVAKVELNQVHAQEMQAKDFKLIEAGQQTVLATLKGIEAKLNLRDVEAERLFSNPEESPAGRLLLKSMAEIEERSVSAAKLATEKADVALAASQEGQKKWAYLAGAAAVGTILLQIFGPAVRVMIFGS